MKKLTQLEKFGLMAGAIVAMSFFYMNKMYDPQAKALEKTIKELNKVTEELNSIKDVEPAEKLQKRKKAKEEKLDAVNRELEKLSLRSGTDEGLVRLEGKIYSFAEECGLLVTEVIPGEPIEELFKWHVYNIKVAGSHRGFIMFLGKLKELPDPVKVEKISLSREKTDRIVTISFALKI